MLLWSNWFKGINRNKGWRTRKNTANGKVETGLALQQRWWHYSIFCRATVNFKSCIYTIQFQCNIQSTDFYSNTTTCKAYIYSDEARKLTDIIVNHIIRYDLLIPAYVDTTFWWSAIILLEKGNIYLVEQMWWNHLDSTPH